VHDHDENPWAGQGPVLLDIGGEHGALVVTMPPTTEGLEVEVRPAGATAPAVGRQFPHVAVVARPGRDGPHYSLVYPDVVEGTYDLVPRPGDDVVLRVEVLGGAVATAVWPGPGPPSAPGC
jgi:hypothetical protein